jgi:hypothetical protein
LRDISKDIVEVAKNYHFTKPPAAIENFMEWLARFIRALLQWWHDLMSPHGSPLDSRNLSNLLQIGVYIVTGAALIWLGFLLYRRARAASTAEAKGTKGATTVEELLDAEGWSKQAEKLAVSGDYKGACRAIYLSLLQKLHENEIAIFAPAKTNYEYSYTLSKYPAVQAPFKELAERVELIWFGNKEAAPEDYQQSKEQLQGMDGEIRRIGAIKAEQKLPKI